MTVQELIDTLMKVEDKDLSVDIDVDGYEDYLNSDKVEVYPYNVVIKAEP